VGLVTALETAGPFGAAAPSPRFAVSGLIVRHARRVGAAHVKCSLASLSGVTVEAIAFGAVGTGLGDLLERVPGQPLHLAGQVEINHWQGRQSVQLRIEDAAPATG
jgi:single-stranded-DNA-specific exonuclease